MGVHVAGSRTGRSGAEEGLELGSLLRVGPESTGHPLVAAAPRHHHHHLLGGSLDISLGCSVGGGGLVPEPLVPLVVHDLELTVGAELIGVQLAKLLTVREGWRIITEDDCQEGDFRQGVHDCLSGLETMAEI